MSTGECCLRHATFLIAKRLPAGRGLCERRPMMLRGLPVARGGTCTAALSRRTWPKWLLAHSPAAALFSRGGNPYHFSSALRVQRSTGNASGLSNENARTQSAIFSPTPLICIRHSFASSYDCPLSAIRSRSPRAVSSDAAATYFARNPRPSSRSLPSPTPAMTDAVGNSKSASEGPILRPIAVATAPTFSLILGTLEVDEQMKETRHSHGSWRSRRRPPYPRTAGPMQGSSANTCLNSSRFMFALR